MATSNGFAMNHPILDGKNYDHWSIQMQAIFGFQECLDVVKAGMPMADENSVEYREASKRDCKISAASCSKEAWKILEKNYTGGKRVKKVRLLTLKRQFELMQMDEQESIAEYLNRIRGLINQMKGCGETLREQHAVEKIFRTLHPKFDHIVTAIEEAKNLDNLTIIELQGSLEFKKKGGPGQNDRFRRDKAKWQGGRRFETDNSKLGLNSQQRTNSSNQSNGGEVSRAKKGNNQLVGMHKKDKSKIQCFNCGNWGHFASECKERRVIHTKEAEARLAKDEESEEEVLLMARSIDSCQEISESDDALLMVTNQQK
ncbi:PREDICTED: uncharacterized protein LOC109353913 [Lupinus angustifolius]|uniref:uncharacterized protein LOC109353913 n=1 Tax=Lupinus angustifolius TaxID=3871 RepID=UPI00092F0E38|nr:PREDICTED: uncharacterized protein LOC109353913 [Lupinus angustifolius]